MDAESLNAATSDDLKAMGLPPAFTVDDLRTFLTDQEIALMAEEDDSIIADVPEDIRASISRQKTAYEEMHPGEEEEDAGDDEDRDDDAGRDTPGSNGAADAAADADQPEADADAGGEESAGESAVEDGAPDPQEGQPVEEATEDQTPDPVLTIKNTADLEAQVSGFKDDLAALQDQYDDGEMPHADFMQKVKELTAAQAKATVELERARDANERASQVYTDAWFGKVVAFTARRPEVIDQAPIAGLPDGVSAYKVFDQALKYVNSTKGAAQFGGLTMAQRIDAAAKLADAYVERTAGRPLLKKAEKPATAKPADPAPKLPVTEGAAVEDKPKAAGPRTDKRPDPVQTLANVTAATDNDVEDSRFAAIDRMDPMEAEAALARLSPEDRVRYLAG